MSDTAQKNIHIVDVQRRIIFKSAKNCRKYGYLKLTCFVLTLVDFDSFDYKLQTTLIKRSCRCVAQGKYTGML